MSPATGESPATVGRQPGGSWRWPSLYLIVSALAVLGAAVVSLRQPWIGDFGLHAAAVGRIQENPLDPADPMVQGSTPSPYFTPYTVLLGVIARVTGASAATLLSAAAPVNLVLLLYGLRRFVAIFTDSRWAPLLALLFVPLLWGTDALEWSGFPSLRGLVLILPYPSTVGLGLMLIGWVLLARALDRSGPAGRRWAVGWAWLGLLGAILTLVHPFTALCAGLGVIALLAGRFSRAEGRDGLLGLSLGAAVAVAVVLSWPYFRISDLLTSVAELDAMHRPLYAAPLTHYGFAFAVGLPALALRFRRDRGDPLVLLFAIAGLVVLVGGVSGGYALGRVWPVLVVSLQVAAAVELSRALEAPARGGRPVRRRGWTGLWAVGTALACLVGLATQYGNLLLMLPSERLTPGFRSAHGVVHRTDYSWVGRAVARGDVVLTGDVPAGRALLGYEIRAVAPPWPDPWLPDEERRRADQAELLDPDTAEPRRRELLTRYGVDWVLDLRGRYAWADRYAVEVMDRPGPARLLRLSSTTRP